MACAPKPSSTWWPDGMLMNNPYQNLVRPLMLTASLSLGKAIINEKTVKGLALRPRSIGSKKVSKFQELTKYDEVAAAENLADPCAVSCQFLIPQLGTLQGGPAWKWQDIFDVSKLQEEINPGSSKAAKAAAGPSGAPAASTSAAAGGSQAKPTLGGGKYILSFLQ